VKTTEFLGAQSALISFFLHVFQQEIFAYVCPREIYFLCKQTYAEINRTKQFLWYCT